MTSMVLIHKTASYCSSWNITILIITVSDIKGSIEWLGMKDYYTVSLSEGLIGERLIMKDYYSVYTVKDLLQNDL